MENITNQLLEKILSLQEDLAEERQENKNLEKELKRYRQNISFLNEENKRQEKKINQEGGVGFLVGIGLTIFLYLFIKFLLWYFF